MILLRVLLIPRKSSLAVFYTSDQSFYSVQKIAHGQRIEGKNSQKQGGIFHFVGIFVGMGFFRSSINLINTGLYMCDSIPIRATELQKTAFL